MCHCTNKRDREITSPLCIGVILSIYCVNNTLKVGINYAPQVPGQRHYLSHTGIVYVLHHWLDKSKRKKLSKIFAAGISQMFILSSVFKGKEWRVGLNLNKVHTFCSSRLY